MNQRPNIAGSNQPVLVTGGAGFIGSHLVEHLTGLGRMVTVIDDFSTGRMTNLASVDPKKMSLRRGTVSDVLSQFSPGDFSEIYHLAAAVGVRLVIDDPIRTIETNVHETSAVLNFASETKTPVLIASTSEVYGKSAKQPFSEDDDVTYGCTRFSRWSYACSKALDEFLALSHHRQRGTPAVIIRFFNTVGPRQVGRYGMVLPRFIEAALADQPIDVYGDGRQTRCFCDVRDVVHALPTALESPACTGRVLNLGSDQPIEIIALAELVCTTLNRRVPIRMIPYDEAFGEGFDDLRHRQPDLAAIKKAIGFEARIPLVQTIRDIAAEMSTRSQSAPSTSAETSVQ